MPVCTAILQSTKVHKEGQQHKSIILTVYLVDVFVHFALLSHVMRWQKGMKTCRAVRSCKQHSADPSRVSPCQQNKIWNAARWESETQSETERENKRLHFKSSMVSASVGRAVGDSCRKDWRRTQHRHMKGKPTVFPHYLTWTGNPSTQTHTTQTPTAFHSGGAKWKYRAQQSCPTSVTKLKAFVSKCRMCQKKHIYIRRKPGMFEVV